MMDKSALTLEQRQRQFLTQSQIRLAKILELTSPELDEAVAREVEENPALEAVDDSLPVQPTDDGKPFEETEEQLRKADYRDADEALPYCPPVKSGRATDDGYSPQTPDTSESLYDILLRQIGEKKIGSDVAEAARYIIGNLDSNGYLRLSVKSVADDMSVASGRNVPEDTVREALRQVQSLEPYGIAAADLRECLLIQLRCQPRSQQRDDALDIIENAFEALSMKHTHRIISQLHLDAGRVDEAMQLILSLNPKPGASLGNGPGSRAAVIIPDFIIDVNDGDITVTVANRYPELRISESFEQAVKDMERNAVERHRRGADFFRTRYNEARDFISLLRQRQTTLFSVMTAIVKAQKEYFVTEDVRRLRPMGIKDIAAATGYDMSVISRATAGKYAATPAGIVPLRFFFSDSMGSQGEEFTSKAVRQKLKALIDNEDKRHPLSDQKLCELIGACGYDVSRRTIAKYRDKMEIPVARLRRKL